MKIKNGARAPFFFRHIRKFKPKVQIDSSVIPAGAQAGVAQARWHDGVWLLRRACAGFLFARAAPCGGDTVIIAKSGCAGITGADLGPSHIGPTFV